MSLKSLRNAALAFLAFSSFTAVPVLAQEQWVALNSPASPGLNLSAVFFTGANVGYVAGDSGQIHKTTDGGTTWSTQVSGVTVSLMSLYFANTNVGYVSGDSGRILKTTNGGASWVLKSTGTTAPLYTIKFHGPDTGFAVGADSLILKTTNGGNTWTRQVTTNTGRYNFALALVDADTVFVGSNGPRIAKTTNGGNTWTDMNPTTNRTQYSMHFTTPRTGYSVGESEILKTTDGGVTWSSQSFGVSWLQSVSFADTSVGYVVGSDIILKTTNAGTSWVEQTRPVNKYLEDVHFVDRITGYAVGQSGTILKHVFTVPAAPTLNAPNDNAQNTAVALNLTWGAVSFTDTYRVQVATDSLFANKVADDSTILSTTTYIENLSFATTYFWRVRGKNEGGVGAWSTVRRFTTLPPPIPAAPVLVAPAAGATQIPSSTTLIWNRSAHATTYRIQVGTDSLFATTVVDDSTQTDSSRAVAGLGPNTKYFWRVNAKNVTGTSSYSSVRSFVTTILAAIQNPHIALRESGLGGNSLRFDLPSAVPVRIRLYDSKGVRVAELVNETKAAGSYELSLDGVRSAGLYVLEFRAGNHRQVLKLIR